MTSRICRLQVSLGVLSVIALAGTAVVAFAGQPVVHGIISQGYMNSSDYSYLAPTEPGTFSYNEALLNVSAPVTDNIRVGAQLMARNLGHAGNENVVLDWAYGDYRFRDEFGLRVGKVKTPFGLYNQTRDVDMVRNSVLLPQSVYTELMRDVMNAFEGASAYGTLTLSDAASLEYDAFLGTVDVEGPNFPVDLMLQPMMAQMWGSFLPLSGWVSEGKDIYGGALRMNTPLEGLRLSGTIFHGAMDGVGTFAAPLGYFTPEFSMEANYWWVLSAEYTTEKLLAAFEFNRASVDMALRNALVPTGLADPATMVMDIPIKDQRGGWYGQATWQFNDWFQLGSYYSMYYPDYTVRDGDGFAWKQRDLAFTARFDLADYWLVKAEVHAMQGTGDVQESLNTGNPFTTENWSLFAVKSTFYF